MEVDYLVAGSGLTGSVIARVLHDAGFKVLVVDRRAHVGCNVYDHTHSSGIRIHTYGPHYFRTSSEKIWSFVNRFARFFEYRAVVKTLIHGKYENWPVSEECYKRISDGCVAPGFSGEPQNFEQAALLMMPASIYREFVAGYTEKQWGVAPCRLGASLAGRFEVRRDGDPCLKKEKYQGLPEDGYASFMKRMLENIPVLLNCDYLRDRSQFKVRRKVIFTGPIDEWFGYCLGKLQYRGQRREEAYHPQVKGFLQPCGQVNNPSREQGSHIRSLEWKHMMQPEYAGRLEGTVITTESAFTPVDPNCFEYPFPDAANQELYKKYRAMAQGSQEVLLCGRLGEYRYLDMDQAIERALQLAQALIALRQTEGAMMEVQQAARSLEALSRI